jgi:hypothetical protein
VKSIFPEAQVLACATDKPRSEFLPVTYEKLQYSRDILLKQETYRFMKKHFLRLQQL